MNCDTFLCFLDTYQVLIAGALAIVAAGVAYRGARRQALAILEAEKQRAAGERRAVAAALFAELASLGARMFADSQRLASTRARDGRMLGLTPLDVSVFSADPSKVGLLPADEAFMVTQAYKLIIDLNLQYARVSESPGVADDYPSNLGHQLNGPIGHVRVTLRGLRETAGISEDKAESAIRPWTPVVRS